MDASELYDPTHPKMPLPLPLPQRPPNALAAELRKDADAFRRKMRDVLLHLDAKRAREISSRADYLKAAETGEDDRLETLHEEVEGLTQETAELFSEMLDVLQRHHAFLGQVADAMEK
jgi:hypothetical protein